MIYDFKKNNEKETIYIIGTKFSTYEILIDDEDKSKIISSLISWHVKPINGTSTIFSYAVSKGKGYYITLPQFLLQTNHRTIIKHLNNNPFDCRKENLKIVK